MKTITKILVGMPILLILNISCKKEITNPFDPDCPKEIWTPSNFKAAQSDNFVNLTWNQDNTNIEGFKIERKVGNPGYANIASPGKTATSWSDSDLKGGELHQYRLYAYAGENQSNTVSTSITPVFKPTVTIDPATNVKVNSATLNGKVNANGTSTTITFLYKKKSSSEWISIDANPKTVTGNSLQEVYANLTNLPSGTEYEYKIQAENSKGTVYSTNSNFTTPIDVVNILEYLGINQTNINLRSRKTLGQITINPPVSGKVIVSFDGMCFSSPGDRIILAASNSTSWGADDRCVTVEAINSDINGSSFSHTRVYNVSQGNNTFYAVAQNYVETAGTGIASIYGSLTVQFIPASTSLLGFYSINKLNINLASETTVGSVTIKPSVSGKAIVKFDGYCISSPGDRIILAASNTTSWGINDGSVSFEAVSDDINTNSFSHTRVYDVSPGSHTFYAIAHNYVETAGTGIASIYGSLTVQFIPASGSVVHFLGINKTNFDFKGSAATLAQIAINPSVSGKVLLRFDGKCISSPGDRIILAASNTPSWGANDGNVAVEAFNNDINTNPFSHTRVYNVSPGSKTFYAVGQNYIETDGTGIASVYGSFTLIFSPD
jgi:hypothetical protein